MEKLEEARLEKAPTEKKRKAKEPKQAVEPKSATFPLEGKINKYGFIFLSSDVQAAFNYTKGQEMRIIIDMTPEGALVICKA